MLVPSSSSSRCTSIYPNGQFEEMCELVRRKNLDLGSVVSHDLTLDDAVRAFQIADSATTGKVCFHLD
jgi:threonine dehydrogenase-like Zn-dependent dehydrogenase